MGEHAVQGQQDPEVLQRFMQHLLRDVQALEKMLEEDYFETDVRRIGAEQELFLVDSSCRPSMLAMEVLEAIDDPHFTTELARFNLECNLDPVPLGETCLSQMENQLEECLALARRAAAAFDVDVALTGILPTLDKNHLSLDNMAPIPRYFALSEAMSRLRGSEFSFHIKGRDELVLQHETVMLESCNTSFQFHFQVAPRNFAKYYNIAQLVAGPVLAAAANSPLLFGKRLWHETRIALFQQAVDTRQSKSYRRQQRPRVSFGQSWVDESVLEIFREDISRFRLLVSCEVDEDPFDALADGRIPKLKALRLHNGTVYRWNRPCYGLNDGKPHMRIENRVLPSGPTVRDEMANGAFWLGLVKALGDEYGDVRPMITFDAARENFLTAARRGLEARFHWLGERSLGAPALIRNELLPRAHAGLEALGIGAEDRSRYLEVIEERVKSGRNGTRWALDSLAALDNQGSPAERLAALAATTVARQKEGRPVHEWPLARLREAGGWEEHYRRVSGLMTTDLFTVNQDEVIDLAASLMDWQHIRHVPVEDNEHRLVGLVTHRILLRRLIREHGQPAQPIPVREVMATDLVIVEPDTPSLEAIALMKEHRIACLPVVENERLVGMVSERDFMKISDHLLEEFLGGQQRQ